MNYIDGQEAAPQIIDICTKIDNASVSSSAISWTMTMDGNDDPTVSFATPSANFNISAQGYFQRITADFSSEGSILTDEAHYVLKGSVNGSEVVYRGKIFVTSKDLSDFSVNEGKYTLKNSSNNFTILD